MAPLSYYIRHLGLIIVIFSTLFVYAMLRGSFISWFLFYSFLPILIYQLSFILYPIHRWHVVRTLSQSSVEAGGSTMVTLTIKRKFPFPIFYSVFEEQLPSTLAKIDEQSMKYANFLEPYKQRTVIREKNIVYPFFRRTFTVNYPLKQLPRGAHNLSTIQLRTGDMFGMFKKQHHFSTKTRLTVFPAHHMIRLQSELGVTFQGTHGTNQIQLKNTNQFAGVRQYMPGDRFSWIHWKQTAKHQEIMTKEFEQQKSTDAIVVLDACLNGREATDVFEIVIEFCYSLIRTLSRHFLHVSFYGMDNHATFISNVENVNKSVVMKNYFASLQQTPGHFTKNIADNIHVIKSYNPIFIVTMYVDQSFLHMIDSLSFDIVDVHVFIIQSAHNVTEINESVANLVKNNVSHTLLTEQHIARLPIEVNI